eukprot:434665-Amphidinium_carterae.1
MEDQYLGAHACSSVGPCGRSRFLAKPFCNLGIPSSYCCKVTRRSKALGGRPNLPNTSLVVAKCASVWLCQNDLHGLTLIGDANSLNVHIRHCPMLAQGITDNYATASCTLLAFASVEQPLVKMVMSQL